MEFCNLKTCQHWASSSLSLQFRVFFSRSRSCGSTCSQPSVLVSCDSLFLPIISIVFQAAALWPQCSDGSESCWFSVCSDFFLLWAWEWQLPNFLYLRPETRHLQGTFYYCSIIINNIKHLLVLDFTEGTELGLIYYVLKLARILFLPKWYLWKYFYICIINLYNVYT